MTNEFLRDYCDRCGSDSVRVISIMSWFTEDIICMECQDKEREIRKKLPKNGDTYEGCGFIPHPENYDNLINL